MTAGCCGWRLAVTGVRFATAYGSLREAHAAIRIAVAWGYVSGASASEVLAALDALGARVFGLARK